MSTLFLQNPRLTLLTIGLIVVAGLSSYVILPRMEDPLLTERAAFILTSLPGADAEQVESLVTEKIEDELREIAEIKEIRTASRSSLSTITVELRDDIYADQAPTVWSRIRDRVADAEASLPANASKPKFERIEVTAYTRIIALIWEPPDAGTHSLTSVAEHQLTPELPPERNRPGEIELRGLAITRRLAEDLRERLLAVPGTKDVDIFGDPDEEITVEIQPERIAALGLSADVVSRLIRSSDSRFSAGLLRNGNNDLLMEVSGELDSLDRIASIPLQTSVDGKLVTVGDVADVRRGIAEPMSELAIVEGRPAIVVACLIRPNQRIDWWNVESEQVTDEFSAALPRGIRMVDAFSQDGYVTTRLTQLRNNMLIGAVSVMLVVLFMMGWRSAVIVGAALPLSAFMVFAGMRFLGIPVHQMSITGLIIALGLLIDNAIVVVDEIGQKLRTGESAATAVGRTVRHLAVPLFGSTFTTALAFAPIAVMPGPAGEFVGSIAVNVIVAIFSSLLLAMTVVPALAGFLGQGDRAAQRTWLSDGWGNPLLLNGYRRLLRLVTARPVLGVLFGILLPLFGFVQARLLPEQFFPPADRDQIAMEVELSSQASVHETLRATQQIRERLLRDPGIEEVTWWIGRSAPPFYYNQIAARRGESRYAQALVRLRSAERLPDRINTLQTQLDQQFPEARILVRQLEQGPPFEAPIEVQVFGPDLNVLAQLSDSLNQVLASLPEVTHVRSETSEPQPRLTFTVDEEQARLVGMTHESLAGQLYAQLEGHLGGMIMEGTEELPVRVRVASSQRTSVDRIEALDFMPTRTTASTGYAGVPLTALGNVELKPEQSSILREDRRRMTEVQAYLEAGVLPAPVQADFQRRLSESGFQLPPGYDLEFGGESAQRNDAVGNLLASVGVLAVLMVAALVLSFKSFRLATLIGVVALLSVGLGLGALWTAGFPFGFMAIIGTMGLVGVAINDSIVVLAAIQGDDDARNGDLAAIRDVIVRATRHVVATSLTTIAGFLPLIVAGGGFWPPLAVTIAGGVGGATILALIFVPSCYLLLMPRLRNTGTELLSDCEAQ
ncbi:MAG: efflux RND transporter permease subunit [Planctomycetaceae bacterium]